MKLNNDTVEGAEKSAPSLGGYEMNTAAEKRAYKKFIDSGMTPEGACGLIGNLEAESDGFYTNRVEYLCLKRLKENGKEYTDETYTADVDSGRISRAEFLNPLPGKQYGFGLAQWTSPGRKAGLYDLVKEKGVSIADENAQLEWLLKELKTTYSSVMSVLKTAKSIRTASDIVLKKFEAPANVGESVCENRAERGQKFYNNYVKNQKEEATMGKTAQDVLNVMISWKGFSEANGKFKQIIDLYNSVKPLPRGYAVKYTDEWCDTTVSAAGIKSGCTELIGRECGCEEHVKIFKAMGIWIEDGTITPKPGDIILYNWDQSYQPNDGYSDHIGFVEAVSNGQITCIEGNKGEAVAMRVISVGNGYIRGYARPKYSGAGTAPSVPVTPPSSSEDISREIAWYGVVNTKEVNVRTWAGTENGQLKSYPTIKQGTKVGVCDTIKDKDGDPWYFVKISGDKGDKYGFVSAAYITKQESSTPNDTTMKDDGIITKEPQWVGRVTADSLNVRTWAGTNNPNIKSWPTLGFGNLVDVCDVVNANDGSRWYYVRIDGRIFGFVHSAYITRN